LAGLYEIAGGKSRFCQGKTRGYGVGSREKGTRLDIFPERCRIISKMNLPEA